jgi:hypothetical protein
MRQYISTFMLSVGLRAQLTHAGVRSMCHLLAAILPSLQLEAPEASDEVRMRVLIRLHREQPGGRAVAASTERDTEAGADQNDKLLADAEYLDLHTKVVALDVAAFDVVAAIALMAGHTHPAGLITMSTTRKPQQPAWSQVLGVRQKSSWAALFDRALARDATGVPQPSWGRMLPVTDAAACPTATMLVLGKFQDVKDWWSVCLPWLSKYEGQHVADSFTAQTDPSDFWLDPSRLRMVEEGMRRIFAAVGHAQSRSQLGSFRDFYTRQILRAEELRKVPPNVMLYPELVRRAKLAVSQTFAQYGEFHAAMLQRPFHAASRRVLIDPSGPVATAFAELDAELARAKIDLARAAQGRAVFQAPHLQLYTPSPPSIFAGVTATHSKLPGSVSDAPKVSLVSFGSPGSFSSPPAGQPQWPAGYFNCWGNMALRHGVYTKAGEGIIFGNRLVKKRDGGDIKVGCVAALGPNKDKKLNSAWCCDVQGCLRSGYAAHERPSDAADLVVSRVPKGKDLSSWTTVVAPRPDLANVRAPNPSWSLDEGPSMRNKNRRGPGQDISKKRKGKNVSFVTNEDKQDFDWQRSPRKPNFGAATRFARPFSNPRCRATPSAWRRPPRLAPDPRLLREALRPAAWEYTTCLRARPHTVSSTRCFRACVTTKSV